MVGSLNCKPDCKVCNRATPVKRELLDISRRAAFQNIPMHVLEFLAELQNAEISPVALLRTDFTTDTFPTISKLPGTLTRNNCGGVSV